MTTEVEKQSFNVSSAHPDKVVVNGVDLVNRAELSSSQNVQLQRFIDNNSHLLGFFDRPKDEKSPQQPNDGGYYGGVYDASLNRSKNYDYNSLDSKRNGGTNGTNASNRVGSPYSDYGSKSRKGVSFADDGRGRSHSPSHGYGTYDPYADGLGRDGRGSGDHGKTRRGTGYPSNYGNSPASTGNRRPASVHGSGSKRQHDQSLRSRTESPNTAPFRWKPYSSYEPDYEKNTILPPYPTWLKDRNMSSTYSSLQRHPDDYNKYDTQKYISRGQRSSREKDEEIKFYGYGDRLGSGIELSRKRWTGGELIVDPDYLKKSLKPRTLFYSPIGDGVVAADGIELKRGPVDLTPKVHVTHERVVEYGKGKPGRRVYEKTWDEGNRGNDYNDDGNRGDDIGDLGGWPYDDGNRGKRPPFDDDGNRGDPFGKGRWPSDDLGNRGDGGDPYGTLPRSTPLSFRSGTPREGWTKEFIINPRELINQYGTETLTTIFDLEDHTPKTLVTTKEVISSVEKKESTPYQI